MKKVGRILFADDEESFRGPIAKMLQKDGYECDCASDASEVVAKLKEQSYDLLISDICMPGNVELELIKKLSKVAEGMPIILITGYPSVDSAVESIKLAVEAYLVKPFKISVLRDHVEKAIEHSRAYRSIMNTRKRLQEWDKDLENIKTLISGETDKTSSVAISTFYDLTLQNIVDCLMELKHLTDTLISQGDEQYVCNLLNCPSLKTFKGGLFETVKVLKKTKNAFKSKDLAELRKKVETILDDEEI
jgi:DNA-binding response OmpR family regulator